jgi:hypothetical protein
MDAHPPRDEAPKPEPRRLLGGLVRVYRSEADMPRRDRLIWWTTKLVGAFLLVTLSLRVVDASAVSYAPVSFVAAMLLVYGVRWLARR